ncbi:MAG: tetratricopeptide repeat protein, partial [Akkermansia sp.]|nr:tetratricopeptide repeat protein [Akkermansia sp.]
MNHTPLINSKRTMILAAIAVSCPFAQADTAGYITTSSAAGTSQVGPTAQYAGDAQDSINAREAARRKAKTNEALELLQQGRTCYTQKEYVQALEKYEAAWKVVPKAPATKKLQEFLVKSIGDASIAVAIEYSRIGRYDEAEQLLLDVLERDPNNKRARQELSLMRDPVRNNPALTPEHVKNVEEVNRLLNLAWGYYELGKYDEAYAEFNRVIKIDPYNTAARRGQEAVSKRRTSYYRAAHDSYRAKALAEVDALWEEQIPQELPTIELGGTETVATSEGVLRNRDSLLALKIANVNFEGTPMADALEFLRAEARKNGQRINFIFEKAQAPVPTAAPVAASSDDEEEEEDEESDEEEEEDVAAPVAVYTPPPPAVIDSLQMSDVSAADLLARMCSQAGCEYRVEENAVVVYQKGAGAQRMTRRQWTVRPSFFNGGEEGSDEDEEDSDFSSGGSRRAKKIDAKASLIDMGVNFPTGAMAKYSPVTGVLTVTNTDDELDTVEEAINKFRQDMPKMVKVSAKFVEISQTNEEELSFDWVVNPFSINNSGSTYIGGVNGSNSLPGRLVEDFVSTGGSAFANNYSGDSSWPINSTKTLSSATDLVSNGLMTGGLRSGSGAITSGALTNLMNSGSAGASATASPAPGVMSLSGIFDSGSYQMIMRGLSQKKGVDVMSAPSLVISGDEPMEYAPAPDQLASDQNDETGCAKIEVIRRFVYPTEYDEPQIESSGNGYNNNNNDNNNGYSGSMPVAAPANPSAWGVEEVGVMLRFQIEPLKEGDGDIVRFKRFEIRVVDFEGFVNYGSPITAGIANQKTIEHIVLTENRIDMPIFSRRYINSNPCVYDGHTIAIGGMIQ